MKTKYKFNTLALALLILLSSFTINASNNTLDPDPEKDKVLIYVLKNILTRGHFVVKDMNDDFFVCPLCQHVGGEPSLLAVRPINPLRNVRSKKMKGKKLTAQPSLQSLKKLLR